MINLKAVANYLLEKELLQKPLAQFSKSEIEQFCLIVIEAANTDNGFAPPFIKDECLYIPANAPRKYRWWQGGQSIQETLTELGASDGLKEKYRTPERPGKWIPK